MARWFCEVGRGWDSWCVWHLELVERVEHMFRSQQAGCSTAAHVSPTGTKSHAARAPRPLPFSRARSWRRRRWSKRAAKLQRLPSPSIAADGANPFQANAAGVTAIELAVVENAPRVFSRFARMALFVGDVQVQVQIGL
eukprot:352362-Chlamydomonas_euryale.AAC.6